jgi:hypothetical protein
VLWQRFTASTTSGAHSASSVMHPAAGSAAKVPWAAGIATQTYDAFAEMTQQTRSVDPPAPGASVEERAQFIHLQLESLAMAGREVLQGPLFQEGSSNRLQGGLCLCFNRGGHQICLRLEAYAAVPAAQACLAVDVVGAGAVAVDVVDPPGVMHVALVSAALHSGSISAAALYGPAHSGHPMAVTKSVLTCTCVQHQLQAQLCTRSCSCNGSPLCAQTHMQTSNCESE